MKTQSISKQWLCRIVAALLCASTVGSFVKADVVATDDFEGLTLLPFLLAGGTIGGDGSDWTKDIRTGTPRVWTIDNSGMVGTTTQTAYFGWSAMDADSWIDEQGVQVGRGTIIETGTNNTALIADPDAWDDFTTGGTSTGYNSYIEREYDLSGFTPAGMTITMDYEFVTEDTQAGDIAVSFDNGATWQVLATFDSTTVPNNTFFTGESGVDFFTEGTDFTATGTTMLLRFGCFNSGNDWWFAIDDIVVETTDGYNDTEDFEGLTLDPFDIEVVGDGTDYTNIIPNWTIDNSGNLGICLEPAYDGWTAMDVFSWADEQGGQGRTLFNIVDPNNTVLVADGDAFYDYDVSLDGSTGSADPEGLNTYISRTYDMSGYDNCTAVIQFEYEFRVENQQLGVAEVSFDGGSTWERVLELDDNDGSNGDVLAGLATYTATTDFAVRQSNTMIFRFGYLNADNNWWFAIDNVTVEADPITYVKGDANGNGVTNNQDIAAFVNALLSGSYDVAIDMNCDGLLNNQDLAGFVNIILGN